MVGVHVLQHEIGDDERVFGVRRGDHFLERLLAAEARLHLGVRDGPVAVVSGVVAVGFEIFLPRAIRVAVDRREPKHVDAEFLEIALLDFLADALEIAALVVGGRQHAVVLHRSVVAVLAVGEAVGEGVINDAILPLESLERLRGQTGGIAHLPGRISDHNADPRSGRRVLGGNQNCIAGLLIRQCTARSARKLQHRGHRNRRRTDHAKDRFAVAGGLREDDRGRLPSRAFHADHRIFAAHAVGTFLRVTRVEIPLPVDDQFVGMASRRERNEQFVGSVLRAFHLVRSRVPPVELPSDMHFGRSTLRR